MEGRGTIRGERMSCDQRKMGANCSGRVAIEQTTDRSMPAWSMEASSPATVPSRWERMLPSFSKAGMAVAATRSGKAWV